MKNQDRKERLNVTERKDNDRKSSPSTGTWIFIIIATVSILCAIYLYRATPHGGHKAPTVPVVPPVVERPVVPPLPTPAVTYEPAPTAPVETPVQPSTEPPIDPIPEQLPAEPPISPTPDTPMQEGQTQTDAFEKDGNRIEDMIVGDNGIFESKSVQKSMPAFGIPYPSSLINFGKRYIGTPYQYGAARGNPASFDCSAYTYYVYLKAIGQKLPMSSRTQKEFVQAYGSHRWGASNWRKASPGDLFFFTSYRGTRKSDYAGVNSSSPVSHVGMYIGNGQLLHTASAPMGVRIQSIAGTHLEYRLTYIGRPY